MLDIQSAQAALDALRAQGFTFFLSGYGQKFHITLTKHAFNGINNSEVQVKGEGVTVTECVENALANFPKNPLDGSRWKTDRLTGPVTDGEFTETETH